MKKKELIITDDGSNSYFVPEVGESYHSSHGAVQESIHIFIESGLKQLNKDPLNVFEMGFGSGLNALLTWDFARKEKIRIKYEAIELFPISVEDACNLNYPEFLDINEKNFLSLHECKWESANELSSEFTFIKKQIDLLLYIKGALSEEKFDLVYFDAFSPEAQPELWRSHIFSFLYDAMAPGSILTSYSVRGDFRRSLQSVGFRVERIPGPPGKRQITRAFRDL